MDIPIGAEVRGPTGKLGTVHGVMLDEPRELITDLVVQAGILGGEERVIPATYVVRAEDGVVHVDLDEKAFSARERFTEDRYRGPDPDYSGPPGHDRGADFLMDTAVAEGALLGMAGAPKPFGFPGGEQVVPEDEQRPVISDGMDVLDVHGEKVGALGEFHVSAETGAPTRLSLRHGLLGTEDTPLPVAWVERLSSRGVVLGVPKDEIEHLAD
jgi:sporulation protein YlmC with PRC-barrel domain